MFATQLIKPHTNETATQRCFVHASHRCWTRESSWRLALSKAQQQRETARAMASETQWVKQQNCSAMYSSLPLQHWFVSHCRAKTHKTHKSTFCISSQFFELSRTTASGNVHWHASSGGGNKRRRFRGRPRHHTTLAIVFAFSCLAAPQPGLL